MIIVSSNHWWQNWPKTHAYVAQKMFFPTSAGEIAIAIQTAEADQRPLRAVGGGWSFSDASLPGTINTNRPNVYAVEALSAVIPRATTFPPDQSTASIASITGNTPTLDLPGSMVMYNDHPKDAPAFVDKDWSYLGGGNWMHSTVPYLSASNPGFLNFLAGSTWRPIRNPDLPKKQCVEESDRAGSLVMCDLAKSSTQPSRDWFYNGNGVWSVGVAGDSEPNNGSLYTLAYDKRLTSALPSTPMNLSPRAAQAGESLSLLLSKQPTVPATPEPVYLINTRSLVSSLQQHFPAILSDSVRDATSDQPSYGKSRRYFFHVEAGITIAELGRLLAHQSPRLSLQAISGSPGATLAGALATGTHGAEFNWPLVVDRVKAVHLVGPGGLHWWIEGSESIADPQKIQAAYPDIALERIISGAAAPGGIVSKDWLNAAVVSMGSIGVLYSVVLEVVPIFGVHEIVVQTTWENLNVGTRPVGSSLATLLRAPATAATFSSRIVKMLQAGNLNGTGIVQVDAQGKQINQYADLAINPNRRSDGDFDSWIGNRELTPHVPIDPQPGPGNETGDMIRGIGMALGPGDLSKRLRNLYGFGSDIFLDVVGNIFTYSGARGKLSRVTQASDMINVALDTLLTPMIGNSDGGLLAQTFLTGVLSGLLGTANCDRRSDKTGVSVGALGFPEGGVMGTALEIALSPADAFGFVQTEILDHADLNMNKNIPFFGYVSIRLCSMTESLMGMQQFGDAANPVSVMIEVVGYGTRDSRKFMQDLQQRTLDRIEAGTVDAMLHWGLENDLVRGRHLRKTKALQKRTQSGMSKLGTFKAARAWLHTSAPGAYRVFDNSFTDRLGLSTLDGLVFLDDQQKAINIWHPIALGTQGLALLENTPRRLYDLPVLNQFDHDVQVIAVRITSSKDAGAPVFKVMSRPPFSINAGQIHDIWIEYTGTRHGLLTGIVEVECDDPIEPIVRIPLSVTVVASKHPELQLTPTSLDLSTRLVGTTVWEDLTIKNIGDGDATFANIEVSPTGPFTVHPSYPASALPGGLAPGSSVVIRVLYQPMARGAAHATLVIDMRSLDPQYKRSYEIPLAATAHMPTLFLADGPQRWVRGPGGIRLPVRDFELKVLDFGVASPTQTSAASFWIRNVGDAPLNVKEVSSLHSLQDNFLAANTNVFPMTVPPGGEQEVPCVFTGGPISGKSLGSELKVVSDDPLQPITGAILLVKGRTAGPHLVEPIEFEQGFIVVTPSAPTTFTFQSDGTDPVTVREVKLIELNPGTNFSVSSAPQIPATLAPGTELTLAVTLTATPPDVYEADLLVAHNGNPRLNSQVRLRGNVP